MRSVIQEQPAVDPKPNVREIIADLGSLYDGSEESETQYAGGSIKKIKNQNKIPYLKQFVPTVEFHEEQEVTPPLIDEVKKCHRRQLSK